MQKYELTKKWEREMQRQAAVQRVVQRAVSNVLLKRAQLQADPMQDCVKHSTRVQKDQVRICVHCAPLCPCDFHCDWDRSFTLCYSTLVHYNQFIRSVCGSILIFGCISLVYAERFNPEDVADWYTCSCTSNLVKTIRGIHGQLLLVHIIYPCTTLHCGVQ